MSTPDTELDRRPANPIRIAAESGLLFLAQAQRRLGASRLRTAAGPGDPEAGRIPPGAER